MPLHEATLNRQLEQADARLSAWGQLLKERGVSAEQRSKDAKWRRLSAECAQIRARIGARGTVTSRDADAAQRKADKLAEAAAPKVKAPKAKGGEKGAKDKPKKEKKPKEAPPAE